MQQLADEANPDAPPPTVIPKMTASENRLPLHDRVKFDMDVVQAHLEKWKSKGHLQLKPDCLSWTPFLVTRGPHQEITAAMNSKDPSTAPNNALRDGQSPVEILDIDKEHPTVVDKNGLEIDLPDPAQSSSPEATLAPLVVAPDFPQDDPVASGPPDEEPIVADQEQPETTEPNGQEGRDIEMSEPDALDERERTPPPPVLSKVNGTPRATRQSSPVRSPAGASLRSSPRRGQQAPQPPSNARPAQLTSASKLRVGSPRTDKSPRRIFQNGRKSPPLSHSSDDSDLEDEMQLKPGRKGSDMSGSRRKLRSPSGFGRSLSAEKPTPSAPRHLPIRTRDSSSLDEDEQDQLPSKKARFANSASDSQHESAE